MAMWMEHPVTKEMLKLIEISQLDKEATLKGIVVNGGIIGDKEIQIMSQLRGQIGSLSEVLNIKDYLLELAEEQKNEVSSTGSENTTQSTED